MCSNIQRSGVWYFATPGQTYYERGDAIVMVAHS